VKTVPEPSGPGTVVLDIGGGVVWATLFPALHAGDYEFRVRAGASDGPTGTVAVSGGRVAAGAVVDGSLAPAPAPTRRDATKTVSVAPTRGTATASATAGRC
jgi:hypothetical protein